MLAEKNKGIFGIIPLFGIACFTLNLTHIYRGILKSIDDGPGEAGISKSAKRQAEG